MGRATTSSMWLIVAVGGFLGAAMLGCISMPEQRDVLVRPDADPFAGSQDDPVPARPPFDPDLVDPRPLGPGGATRVNQSAATFRIDIAEANDKDDAYLVELHRSYAEAAKASGARGVLPSVDLIDGKAKQFDDALVGAVEVACVRGRAGRVASLVALVKRLAASVGPASPAAPHLAAALELAGESVSVDDVAAKGELLREFDAAEILSKPAGFYDASDELRSTFRFLRFLMMPLDAAGFAAKDIAIALARDESLRADYVRTLRLFDGLTNPARDPTFADPDARSTGDIHFLPRAHSVEDDLAARVFPSGIPPDANLMGELVRRVRSGEIDLTPRPNSGWYDRQAHALETLLLPERAAEHAKLQLTKTYKERLVRSFAALLAKRRETHWRSTGMGCGVDPSKVKLPDGEVKPRLRLEPAVTYYLRTARAYAFLADFLDGAFGEDALRSLHGLSDGRERPADLASELHSMRDLFYGCALVAAEDLGTRPPLAADEPVDVEACRAGAAAWITKALDDPDLAVDTRVIVPVYADPARNATRMWATLGVRLAKLSIRYDEPPKLRSADGSEGWRDATYLEMGAAEYLIPVDEFAEFEIRGARVLTRGEFRAVCDLERTKERIVEALAK